MKRTEDILGLPIISISNGLEVGKVKSVIVNADKGAIDYVVVDNEAQIFSAKAISSNDILGVGEYALTIEHEDVMKDISKTPSAIELMQKNIQVKDTKVLTKKGRLIGKIGDFYVDDDNKCFITGLEFIGDKGDGATRIIPRAHVITFGKNLIVVTEEVENVLMDSMNELDVGTLEKKNYI